MDDLFAFIPENIQATIFQVLALLSVAMPLLEKLVNMTKTDVDNKVLAVVQKVLGVVPRVRLGKGVTKAVEPVK